jgi:branched-subunit amino acid transport protein
LAGGLLGLCAGNVLLARMGPAHCKSTAWSLRAVAVLVALAVYHLLCEELDFAENLPFQYVLAVVATGSLAVFTWQKFKHNMG